MAMTVLTDRGTQKRTPRSNPYRRAAAKLAAPDAREEIGVAPLARRALAALRARAFDRPTQGLAYPDEIH
ncbi:MAG: hypothetical protein JOZ69_02280, partial [Myxococcales bacterium]|nr:hypothetical protein [Myxococcales bacterium]